MLHPSPARLPVHFAIVLSVAGCAADATGGSADLGDFPAVGKADAPVVVEVPFLVEPGDGETPGETGFVFRTSGQLAVTTHQDEERSWERLQLVAESEIYRRRSWRGRAPFVTVPAERGLDGVTEYSLKVLNWGSVTAYGFIRVQTEVAEEPGVRVVFNTPDCDGCEDPAGELRTELVDAIQSARESIDLAVYGLDDPAITEALCNAAGAGVDVRVVTDDTSEDPEDSRSYWDAFYSPAAGLAGCGARVEAVRSYGIMHHKFLVIDHGEPGELLVTGSANLTRAGLEDNHNHMLFVRGAPELGASYVAEMDQLFRHCARGRLDGRESRCDECTPGCHEDHAPEGPWAVGDSELRAYFSPSDDALRVLRGEMEDTRRAEPDPACAEPDADCVCRRSGSRFACEYCAVGEDGWGLLGEAEDRLLVDVYSATDQCFALGVARAARRGVDVVSIFDFVRSGSIYSRDDYMCSEGVPVYISSWGGGSAQVRNHNKSVVVDDVVFDGSMNLSASGAAENNENTLVVESPDLADRFAEYVESEVELLESWGVTPRTPAQCLCSDLVDNDGDGRVDGEDADCDGAPSGSL